MYWFASLRPEAGAGRRSNSSLLVFAGIGEASSPAAPSVRAAGFFQAVAGRSGFRFLKGCRELW